MGAIQQMLLAEAASVANTYATWDPSGKGADVTLSGGNLTAASNYVGAGAHCVRSTIGKTSGRWYWEITIGAIAGGGVLPMLGICRAAFAITTADFPGVTSDAAGYYGGSGQRYQGAGGVAFGASYTTGDIISFALDATARSVNVYKNNSLQGAMSLAGTDDIYACGVESSTVTANFGATAFTYSPPGGYNSGLYT